MPSVVIIVGVVVCLGFSTQPLLADSDETIRTDLITKTVSAINASLQRSIANCKDECPGAVVQSVQQMHFGDYVMSSEAKALVGRLKSTFDVDWSSVQSWLLRLQKIQTTYFESVLKYRDHDGEPQREALFYLDIGEIHNATAELLENQKSLMLVVADLSTILEIVQQKRASLAQKLTLQLGDLTPYHETFGCAHKCSVGRITCVSGGNGDTDCAAVMRASFKKSFQNLQETLARFFVEEMPESELLDEEDDEYF